jgi:transcriptional regulator CtsR
MQLEKDSIKSSRPQHGGARPGAGRPKGSGSKLTIDKLLQSIDTKLGQPLEDQIAENYVRALIDPKLAHSYEQMFLNKVMADRQQIEIDETTSVESRQAAFLKAIESLGNTANQHDAARDSADNTK